jgi:hypothetical protein
MMYEAHSVPIETRELFEQLRPVHEIERFFAQDRDQTTERATKVNQ